MESWVYQQNREKRRSKIQINFTGIETNSGYQTIKTGKKTRPVDLGRVQHIDSGLVDFEIRYSTSLVIMLPDV